ncbi:pre-mRNA-splicing factor CWC2 [Cryptococcus deuterogattii 99/473]|uniref:Unplaced genomic scaffold supercont1.5, whole genome shotgun sequence n=1 Tax=Cryptococcus deuterogattii Ram5 TaxID=1296110 RepID=A0A0D0V4Z1_9TREE|nr:pre-mRNA-splicing factor CWC2 [Cryptococcus deuterogattii LA55]KIR33962.1 pre-mRNA-splicing factor CWC2 [Cryptococcus deuterogattii MMRL2647]KIR41654.1 pre-mRNA-splicing factor CWC2 [Cryptococcus deuterogattii Ram5]KIR91478.1 pre-mRNA-splicing factor CWC2 [Cryptococcus deuterogattii CBS 10090]KIR98333.1 pre-mRNA-splicing factor CWC2 [Cryptococcus deuterogattii 2001/935-1]KIY54949.1 pre-mRNA-splicing factor CWC2 [Cryptococcus deuterogattii 99/473]
MQATQEQMLQVTSTAVCSLLVDVVLTVSSPLTITEPSITGQLQRLFRTGKARRLPR